MNALTQQLRYLTGTDAFRTNPMSVLGRLVLWRGISAVSRRNIVVKLPSYGVSIAIAPDWHGTSKIIFAYRELYDRELIWLSRNVEPGFVTVDIGAHFGIYTLVAARAAEATGKVYSFEPAAAAFDILNANVELNCLTNVDTYRCALGDHCGEMQLYHNRDTSRNSLGRRAGMTGARESIQMTTLSDILDKTGVEKIDLIKIDVEGAEKMTLKGCARILEKARPRIIIELNPTLAAASGLRADGAWRMLVSLGYKMYEIDDVGSLCRIDRCPHQLINVLAFSG